MGFFDNIKPIGSQRATGYFGGTKYSVEAPGMGHGFRQTFNNQEDAQKFYNDQKSKNKDFNFYLNEHRGNFWTGRETVNTLDATSGAPENSEASFRWQQQHQQDANRHKNTMEIFAEKARAEKEKANGNRINLMADRLYNQEREAEKNAHIEVTKERDAKRELAAFKEREDYKHNLMVKRAQMKKKGYKFEDEEENYEDPSFYDQNPNQEEATEEEPTQEAPEQEEPTQEAPEQKEPSTGSKKQTTKDPIKKTRGGPKKGSPTGR